MADLKSGLFTLNEFKNRNVLKLAPDGFIVINGALGARVVSPVNISGTQDLEVRGGVSNITINAALRPSGASKATIEIIAPPYKGLHEDYYVTLPNGTRIPFFVPMMEIKVYMKGFFISAENDYVPQYYPVFWGLILDVTETYSGGLYTFSLSCGDLLSWWKYQRITMRPASLQSVQGSPTAKTFPTVFENMNPWQIIYALFLDSYFVQEKEPGGGGGLYNFIYAKFSKSGFAPDFGGVDAKETFGALARDTINYWNARFGFENAEALDENRAPLEMYGLRGPISVDTIRESVLSFKDTARMNRASNRKARLDLDFNILANVQPYGAFDLFGDGSEPVVHSKLEIANEVCEQTHMEFYLDTNGSFVFKPPFYNLDVSSDTMPYYTLEAKDLISFTASVNSENIVNFLEVTAPLMYEVPSMEAIGYHIDYESIKRYGLRYQNVAMRYGRDAKTLRLVAAAEMSRINGAALTGSASIPLRPEIRLGYPVYIRHIDAYYYVTGLTHSLAFGSSATTDISLEFKRDRIFDDGTVTKTPGQILKGYVQRFKGTPVISDEYHDIDTQIQELTAKYEQDKSNDPGESVKTLAELQNLIQKDELKRQFNMLAGPKTPGLYEIDKAQVSGAKATEIENADTQSAVVSNELVMITDDTIPYTDINGYKHIGSFPYGANLKLLRSSELVDSTNRVDAFDAQVDEVLQVTGYEQEQSPPESSVTSKTPVNAVTSTGSGEVDETEEAKVQKYTEEVDQRRKEQEEAKEDPNPDNSIEMYAGTKPKEGLNKASDQQVDTEKIVGITPV